MKHANIAVLLPCRDEEAGLGATIRQFKNSLPFAKIYVYDNNSSDSTAAIAIEEGAYVRTVPIQGKGATVRQMFQDIDADAYILCDGDATYRMEKLDEWVNEVLQKDIDMFVGTRSLSKYKGAFPVGHQTGNAAFTGMFNFVFESSYCDLLSGFRIMSKSFVKSCEITRDGFELEVLLSSHAVVRNAHVKQVPVQYTARLPGSKSKLRTISDGLRIFTFLLILFARHRPKRLISFFLLFVPIKVLQLFKLVVVNSKTACSNKDSEPSILDNP